MWLRLPNSVRTEFEFAGFAGRSLGASRRNVLGAVLRDTLVASAAGVVIGLCATFLATRTIASFLFELSPTDPVTLVLVAAGLIAVAALAGLVPAYRAAATAPVTALRAE